MTRTDIARVISGGACLYSLILTGANISSLPSRIPTHFNASGRANGWGPPNTLWFLTTIQILVCAGFWLMGIVGRHFPGAVHLGSKKLSDFTIAQQGRASPLLNEMAAVLSVPFSLLMSYVIYEIIRVAASPSRQISVGWVVASFVVGSGAIALHYIRQVNSITKQRS